MKQRNKGKRGVHFIGAYFTQYQPDRNLACDVQKPQGLNTQLNKIFTTARLPYKQINTLTSTRTHKQANTKKRIRKQAVCTDLKCVDKIFELMFDLIVICVISRSHRKKQRTSKKWSSYDRTWFSGPDKQ
jgi:hypothetical protein